MGFVEMWKQADFIDACIGGVDSIPEEEYHDYVEACLMALADDFNYGKQRKEEEASPPCGRDHRVSEA